MRPKRISRRCFMDCAVPGVGFGSAVWLSSQASAATSQQTEQPGASNSGEMPVPAFREICPQHFDLARKRSQRAHARLEQSLHREDARPVTVAAYQMPNHCGGEAGKRSNLQRMLSAVQAAARQGAQMLAFPEMCLPGYFTSAAGTPAQGIKAHHVLADRIDRSVYLPQLQDAAREAEMVLAFGFCEKDADGYYNSIGVIDADGRWLGTRRKNPLSPQPFDLGSFSEPDRSQRAALFQTRYARVGVSNCFDGEFPESIRQMRLDGAEILLWCNAATGNPELGSSNRIHHSASYAQANRMWVVCCNAVGGNTYGTSVIVGPSGEPLVVLPTDQEALAVATVNLALCGDWDRWRLRLGPPWPKQS